MMHEDDRRHVISVVEESAVVDKSEVVTGRVRVQTVTDEVEQVIDQDLTSETVEITRVPVDREVTEAPAVRQEGDVTIVSVVEEIVVLTKRLVVKEEVHIRRIRSTEHVETSVNLRKQRAVVERSDVMGDSSADIPTGERQ